MPKFPQTVTDMRTIIDGRGDVTSFAARLEGTVIPEGLSVTINQMFPDIQHWYYREGDRIAHYHECFDVKEAKQEEVQHG